MALQQRPFLSVYEMAGGTASDAAIARAKASQAQIQTGALPGQINQTSQLNNQKIQDNQFTLDDKQRAADNRVGMDNWKEDQFNAAGVGDPTSGVPANNYVMQNQQNGPDGQAPQASQAVQTATNVIPYGGQIAMLKKGVESGRYTAAQAQTIAESIQAANEAAKVAEVAMQTKLAELQGLNLGNDASALELEKTQRGIAGNYAFTALDMFKADKEKGQLFWDSLAAAGKVPPIDLASESGYAQLSNLAGSSGDRKATLDSNTIIRDDDRGDRQVAETGRHNRVSEGHNRDVLAERQRERVASTKRAQIMAQGQVDAANIAARAAIADIENSTTQKALREGQEATVKAGSTIRRLEDRFKKDENGKDSFDRAAGSKLTGRLAEWDDWIPGGDLFSFSEDTREATQLAANDAIELMRSLGGNDTEKEYTRVLDSIYNPADTPAKRRQQAKDLLDSLKYYRDRYNKSQEVTSGVNQDSLGLGAVPESIGGRISEEPLDTRTFNDETQPFPKRTFTPSEALELPSGTLFFGTDGNQYQVP